MRDFHKEMRKIRIRMGFSEKKKTGRRFFSGNKKNPDIRTGSFPAMVPLARIGLAFTAYKAVVMAIILKRRKWWNLMGSNHRPLPCEGSDLPLI